MIVSFHSILLFDGKPILFHIPFSGGYLAVEFFFMLTGYFCVEKAVRNPEAGVKDALRWSWEKYKRFAIYVIPFLAMSYLVRVILNKLDFAKSVSFARSSIFDMLLLTSSGLIDDSIFPHLWYLSSVLILSPVFYIAVLKRKNVFLYTACPILTVLIYGWFSRKIGYIDRNYFGTISYELLRAWAGMSMGALVWCAAHKLRSVDFSKTGAKLLTAIELVSLALALTIMYFGGENRTDFICIGLLAIFVSIVMSEKASVHTLFSPVFSKCAEFTLALYIGHYIIYYAVLRLAPNAGFYIQLILCIALAIIYTFVLMLIARIIRKVDIPGRLRRLMLEDSGPST